MTTNRCKITATFLFIFLERQKEKVGNEENFGCVAIFLGETMVVMFLVVGKNPGTMP